MMLSGIIHLCIAGLLLISGGCTGTSGTTDKDMILKIAHYKAPCLGEGVRLCYRIEKDDGRMEFFYDDIEGFAFEWGYRYTISVEKNVTNAPLADGSSFSYKLKKVIKKEKASSLETFELPLRMEGQDLVENKNGKCSYFGTIEIDTGTHSCGDLVTAQSAVFQHKSNQQGLVLVTVK